MNFYSLKNQNIQASFKEATLMGQSPDGGLFFPQKLPHWNTSFIHNIAQLSIHEIACQIMKPYVGDDMRDNTLQDIIQRTLSFDIPLRKIDNNCYVLELFHGPTMAFKDVGARFLSKALAHFAQDMKKEVVVLAATSGDTGGAVVAAFEEVEGVQVVIIYPKGKVSPLQEKQLSSAHDNIHTLEVEGTFDDCQLMVKSALSDLSLKKNLLLTSANSINISRWLPQQIYYLLAYQQWVRANEKGRPIFCVPSGNFGNICAGLLAHISGMPAAHFIAACNANNIVTRYLHTKIYDVKPAIATLSNAMDIGSPNNFTRVERLVENNYDKLRQLMSSYSVSDKETRETIRQVYEKCGYILDPHTAVGYHALKQHNAENAILVATADPIKFSDIIENTIGTPLPVPPNAQKLMDKIKKTTRIKADIHHFRNWLINKF